MNYIIHESIDSKFKFNAGSKARDDIEDILKLSGFSVFNFSIPYAEKREKADFLKSFYYHYKVANLWKESLRSIPAGSKVVFQFPVKSHSIFMNGVIRALNKKSIQTIAIVHDLEYLRNTMYSGTSKRTGQRLKLEEISALKEFSRIIVHNEKMKRFIIDNFNVQEDRIIVLEIFDYLIPDYHPHNNSPADVKVIIAGNLDPDKSGYIYRAPDNISFELYGANFKESEKENLHYNGKFLPDELPAALNGSYGLVWDGSSIDSCEGVFGNYLRYNNPHKTSLYLAAGIPVVMWKQAALADFIRTNNCGLLVDSLNDLSKTISEVTEEQYKEMKANAVKIGELIRNGHFTKQAISKC